MRFVSSIVLLMVQVMIIFSGHLAISTEMLVIGYIAFRELLNVNRPKGQSKSLYMTVFPYIAFTFAIYAFGAPAYGSLLNIPQILLDNHALFSFGIGCLIMMLFVVNLTGENSEFCYNRLGWTLIGCIIIALPAVLYGQIAKMSLMWFFLCIFLVIVNDTGAYFSGRLFGKHQLIALSPKKTVEGFVGALIICVVAAFYVPLLFAKFPFAYCPAVNPFDFHTECDVPAIFVPQEYFGGKLVCYPVQIHSAILGLFASTVAPFGGFLASGLKRVFGLKDFGTLIPGHGGALDRVDCQLVMGSFAILYLKAMVL